MSDRPKVRIHHGTYMWWAVCDACGGYAVGPVWDGMLDEAREHIAWHKAQEAA